MNHEALLHAILFTPGLDGRWGLPVLFRSPPGCAKTSVIKTVGRAAGLPVEHLSPSERGEGAFGVVPFPVTRPDGRTVITYPAPDYVEGLLDGGVLFIDEMGQVEPALQRPIMGILLGGVIGSFRLPNRVRVLCAGNPTEMATGGYDLSMANANRLCHVEWGMYNAQEFADWLTTRIDDVVTLGAESDPKAEEKRVMDAWPVPWAQERTLIANFLKRKSEFLIKPPTPNTPQASGAWPSYRTWEYGARARTGARIHKLDHDEAFALFAGFVGEGAANEYEEYAAKMNLPDPEALLDGAVGWKHDPRRPDITEAVLMSCVALVAPTTATKRATRATALWNILSELVEDRGDLVQPAGEQLIGKGLLSKAAYPVLQKLEPLMRKANLIRSKAGA